MVGVNVWRTAHGGCQRSAARERWPCQPSHPPQPLHPWLPGAHCHTSESRANSPLRQVCEQGAIAGVVS